MVTLMLVWWGIGTFLYGATLRSIEGETTVGDLFLSLFAGVGGPFNLLWWVAFSEHRWLKKRLF